MERTIRPIRTAGLMACSAMVAVLLAGCSGQTGVASTGSAAVSAADLDQNVEKSVALAERAVAKSPQNAGARAQLAQAYLAVGRFASAATTFEDAISLGDSDARNALGLALAYMGAGRDNEALSLLNQWRDQLPVSDYGLAIALAGDTSQGVAVLSDALRGGENTAKLRQNLAYAYALDGRWTEARVVASQDVPADQLDARISEWAIQGRADDQQRRVAGLLGAPMRSDPGQPAALALGRPGSAPAFAMNAPAPVDQELPAATSSEGAWTDTPVKQVAAVASTPEPHTATVTYVPGEVVQPVQASAFEKSFGKASAVPVASREVAGTHVVQLGAFLTRKGAERAWGIFVARNPELKHHTLRITEAEVSGRRFFRVTAQGFDARSSRSMCSTVKGKGGGCFAYAESRGLPGAAPASGSGPMRARRR